MQTKSSRNSDAEISAAKILCLFYVNYSEYMHYKTTIKSL